jgi:hypothetical protein
MRNAVPQYLNKYYRTLISLPTACPVTSCLHYLSSGCTTHKRFDDVILSEVINKHDNSNMYAYFNNVVEWSHHNLMNIDVA